LNIIRAHFYYIGISTWHVAFVAILGGGHFAFFLENAKDVMGRYGQFSQLEQIPPTLNYSVAVNFDWVVLQ
jgi:hypothetical protein